MRIVVDPNVPHYLPPNISERVEDKLELVKLRIDLKEILDKIEASTESTSIELLRAQKTIIQRTIRSRR